MVKSPVANIGSHSSEIRSATVVIERFLQPSQKQRKHNLQTTLQQ